MKDNKKGYRGSLKNKHFAGNAENSNYTTTDVENAFKDAMQQRLGASPKVIISGGIMQRFSTNGKRGDKSGWCRLYIDGFPAGSFGCFRQGISETWRYRKNDKPLTPAEQKAFKQKIKLIYAEKAEEEKQRAEKARLYFLTLWRSSPFAGATEYTLRKCIPPIPNTRVEKKTGATLIPMFNINKEMMSGQRIFKNGEKRFIKGTKKQGLFFVIGKKLDNPNGIWLCEGAATAMSLWEANAVKETSLEQRIPIVVAFDSGNLLSVATAIIGKYPDIIIRIMADDDRLTEQKTGKNTGLEAANNVAAQFANVSVSKPFFPDDAPIELSDFNDSFVLFNQQHGKGSIK